ncbi:MAG: DUF2156 domain-containing protein [Candidatus Saganbacteria bacterium]|nr:DUF2156 domain-containing protein [Candidatus Saganbacteria bacterium]
MIPAYPNFIPLEIGQREEISKHLAATPRGTCELSPGNLFIWKDFDRPQVTLINHNVCVLIAPPNEPPYFLEPFGSHKLKETVDLCLKRAGRVSRASEMFAALLPPGAYRTEPLRNQFDYIYETKALAGLKGKKFDSKRNRIKRFERHNPGYEYRPLNAGHQDEALALFERWFAGRSESRYYPRLAYTSQKDAITRAFGNYEQLGLTGGALLAEKKLKGFTLGSPVNPEMISVHFLYGDPQSAGITQTLLWEACNKSYAAFKYADLEQDLGIPGLRTMKLSYQPLKLEKKYEITL